MRGILTIELANENGVLESVSHMAVSNCPGGTSSIVIPFDSNTFPLGGRATVHFRQTQEETS